MSTIYPSFSSGLITSNFSSVLIVFQGFFTWIALNDVNLHFCVMLVRKASTAQE
jgi:hypothetical protein